MTAAWQTLSSAPIPSEIQSITDEISAILTALNTALKLLTTALDVLQAFAFLSLNLLEAIVTAVIKLIEDFLHDLLENNIAAALHVNANWNPYWVYNKERWRDPRTGRVDGRLIDYENDGQLPWAGTGLNGWLLELLVSTKDVTDPFRPVTDDNTSVYGCIIIKGIANPSDIEEGLGLEDWLKLFTNWKGFSIDPSKVRTQEYFESLSKWASASTANTMFSLWQLGPKDRQILSLQNQGFDVDSGWQFFPTPGSYPKWISAPAAALIPPLQGAIEDLRRILGLLRPADNLADAISKLIAAIRSKIDQLEEGIETVTDAINLVLSLLTFLTDAYIIVYKVDSGGMDDFIADIQAAEDAPDFGTAGIVVGVAFLATQPDLQATLDKFLSVIGIETSNFVSTSTAYSEALAETFEELYPPEEP